jgi:hypothetical protein
MPMLLHLRIPTQDSSLGLWLPWFLIYPILLVLMLVVLPFVLLAAIVLLPLGKARPVIMVGPYLWRVLFALRGLNLEFETGGRAVIVNFV